MPFGRARDLDMYDICATECQIFVKYGINVLKKWRDLKLSACIIKPGQRLKLKFLIYHEIFLLNFQHWMG